MEVFFVTCGILIGFVLYTVIDLFLNWRDARKKSKAIKDLNLKNLETLNFYIEYLNRDFFGNYPELDAKIGYGLGWIRKNGILIQKKDVEVCCLVYTAQEYPDARCLYVPHFKHPEIFGYKELEELYKHIIEKKKSEILQTFAKEKEILLG